MNNTEKREKRLRDLEKAVTELAGDLRALLKPMGAMPSRSTERAVKQVEANLEESLGLVEDA